MNYPSTISDVRAAILEYTPSVLAAREAFEGAVSSPSIVSQSVAAFDALLPYLDELDIDGLKVLAGCARLIGQNSWHGKASEAFTVFARVAPMLPTIASDGQIARA
jgi:hypothetical protein